MLIRFLEYKWVIVALLLMDWPGDLRPVKTETECPPRLSAEALKQLTTHGHLLNQRQRENLLKLEEDQIRNSRDHWRRRRDQTPEVARARQSGGMCRADEGFVTIFTFLILSFNFFYGLSGILNYNLRGEPVRVWPRPQSARARRLCERLAPRHPAGGQLRIMASTRPLKQRLQRRLGRVLVHAARWGSSVFPIALDPT